MSNKLRAYALLSATVFAGGTFVFPQIAQSVTTDTYRYDARGRLSIACHAPEGAGYKTNYSLDRASNRSNFTSQNEFIGLPAGAGIWSADGRFVLTMQADGNLALWGATGALWVSNTYGTGANFAGFQQDGNLVVYGPSGAVWQSGTNSHCAHLVVQNDGNVVILSSTGTVIWATNTGGH